MQELGSCQELGKVDAHHTQPSARLGGVPHKVSQGIARYATASQGIARYPNASHQCNIPATDAPKVATGLVVVMGWWWW